VIGLQSKSLGFYILELINTADRIPAEHWVSVGFGRCTALQSLSLGFYLNWDEYGGLKYVAPTSESLIDIHLLGARTISEITFRFYGDGDPVEVLEHGDMSWVQIQQQLEGFSELKQVVFDAEEGGLGPMDCRVQIV